MRAKPPWARFLLAMWPEIGAVAGCLVLVNLLPLLPALGLTAALYIGLRWAHKLSSPEPPPREATVQELVSEMNRLSEESRLAPFAADLRSLADMVGQASFDGPDDGGALRDFTRTTLGEIVKAARGIIEIRWEPTRDDSVAASFSKLVRESTAHLRASYTAVRRQDSAALAEQIGASTRILDDLRQNINYGGSDG